MNMEFKRKLPTPQTIRDMYPVSPELAQQKARGSQFNDVKLKDSDLTAEGDSRLTGWPYLQALFFRRHRRMLYKPVKIWLLWPG